MSRESILEEVLQERERQTKPGTFTMEPAAFDHSNSRNDWVAFVTAYAGRAGEKVRRNEVEGQSFRQNMLKVAALAVAAIEANDQGWC